MFSLSSVHQSKKVVSSLALASLFRIRDASATLTIAAADSATGQIGASGTSCVDFSLYAVAYHSVPGHGLCMTQAMPPSNPDWDESTTFKSPVYASIDTHLLNDTNPGLIIENITDPNVDGANFTIIPGLLEYNSVDLRQYGCVDLQGRTAGYTGGELQDLYFFLGYNFTDPSYEGSTHVQEDIQGTFGNSTVYSAQGNIVSDTTVPTLADTFSSVEACDLAERLYLSLAAVYENEADLVGDIRCFDTNNASGSSIFIHIDDSDGSEVIHIENESPDMFDNPWPQFKSEYEKWREQNPCVLDITSSTPEMSTTQSSPSPSVNSAGFVDVTTWFTMLALINSLLVFH